MHRNSKWTDWVSIESGNRDHIVRDTLFMTDVICKNLNMISKLWWHLLRSDVVLAVWMLFCLHTR